MSATLDKFQYFCQDKEMYYPYKSGTLVIECGFKGFCKDDICNKHLHCQSTKCLRCVLYALSLRLLFTQDFNFGFL